MTYNPSPSGQLLRVRIVLDVEVDPDRWGEVFSGDGGFVTAREVGFYVAATARLDGVIERSGAKVDLVSAKRVPLAAGVSADTDHDTNGA